MAIKTIDLTTWPRRNLFQLYSSLDYPYFNVCSNVDVTALYNYAKEKGLAFFQVSVYALTAAANMVPEFRCRIRGEEIIEHDAVHPSFTVLTDDNLFGFCEVEYTGDFEQFYQEATTKIEKAKKHPNLSDKTGHDEFLFMSCLPWISFTSISHPVPLSPPDSVPRISWGKYVFDNNRMVMPVSVQVHHGLADGYHAGEFFKNFETMNDRPAEFFKSK